jgi:hypothetical protein
MFGIAKKKMVALSAILGAATLAASQNSASAVSFISNGNSALFFNPSATSNTPYISHWTVGNTDEYGGIPAGGDFLEYYNGSSFVGLNTLPVQSSSFVGFVANVTYNTILDGDNFTINVQDVLSGGGAKSGKSAINETITINNTGPVEIPGVQTEAVAINPPVTFDLLDVDDLNLNGTPNNDTIKLKSGFNPNTAIQTDPKGVKFTYVATPIPTTANIVGVLGDGPVKGNNPFEFGWDFSMSPGDTEIVSIAETLDETKGSKTPPVESVPLPGSAGSALATLAGLGAIALVRRKNAAV